jgi:hypothetical protein
MKGTMTSRRDWLFAWLPAMYPLALAGAEASSSTIRGKLVQTPGKTPVLETKEGVFSLTGDADTAGVLNDKRLANEIFELRGKSNSDGTFAVNPIHSRAMHVLKGGKSLLVTYWCEVCSIRTYTPGICWCCQEYTELDLRENLPTDPQ